MTVRDAQAKNPVDALDFSTRREAVELPAFTPPPAGTCTTTGTPAESVCPHPLCSSRSGPEPVAPPGGLEPPHMV